MMVTPELAKKLLKRGGYHKWKPEKVQRFADRMRAGQWTPTGRKPITIDPDTGTVLNGNHRLRAIMVAGVAVETEVVYETERDMLRRKGWL